MKNKKIAIVVSLIVFLLACGLSSVNAANVTISDNSEGGINQAINGTGSGDTLFLQPGIYNKSTDTNISMNDKNITIIGNGSKNSVIIDAKNNGKVFFINQTCNVTIINVTFINGAAAYGAAIENIGSLTIINCDFINNNASSDGGAIYNIKSNILIKDSNFYNNNGINGGGISSMGENISIINCNFVNNVAGKNGGAVQFDSSFNNLIKGCIFINNTGKSKEGGAVYTIGSDNLQIIDSEFFNNSAKGMGGGALYNNAGDYFTIVNSTFVNNIANGTLGGGAIVNSYQNANGLPHGDYFKVINSTFVNNTAIGSSTKGMGGAITNAFGDYSLLENSVFINNKAIGSYSGVFYNSKGHNFTIRNCSFIKNFAKLFGGAITNAGGENFTVIDSNFDNNSADQNGGAIFNSNGLNFVVKNSNFINHFATESGGVIFSNLYSTMKVTSSNFSNNSAGKYGGVIYNGGNMTVTANDMFDNSAYLGKEIYNDGHMGILNLTYLNNNTLIVDNNTEIDLFALLTDDRGNTITGRSVSFYVNGTSLGTFQAVEGNVYIPYFVTHGLGAVFITGDYSGHKGFDIVVNNGILLIINDTIVDIHISFDKKEYLINETTKETINVINIANEIAYDVIVNVTLPSNFVLDEDSIIISHGFYNQEDNNWYIGNLNIGEEVMMNFKGFFTKTGNYTIEVLAVGLNFDNSSDFDDTNVKQKTISETNNTTTEKEPTEDLTPINDKKILKIPSKELNNSTDNYTKNKAMISSNAAMKKTGMPILTILLMLLSSLGLIFRRK